MMHTLGFFHEHSRYDRDKYIKLNNDSIKDGLKGNFKRYNTSYTDTLNTEYDYGSVLHYSPQQGAKT